MGRLRQQIEDARQGASGLSPVCALRKACAQCKSVGYKLQVEGPIVGAALCDCVRQCAACFGSTMFSVEGQSKPCRSPSPKRIVSLFHEAGLPARYLDADINNFSNFSGNGRDVHKKVQQWLEQFSPEKGLGLILSGPVGVGKTYLLAAICKALLRKSYGVKFIDFHRLLSVIRAGYTDKKSEEEILAPLIDAEVLVIDELGKGRNNDWEQEKLDQIVMGRYNQNKVIIASTNYSLKQDTANPAFFNKRLDDDPSSHRSSFNPDVFETLEARVGKRIFSRLFETSAFVDMLGEDMRKKRRPDLTVDRKA